MIQNLFPSYIYKASAKTPAKLNRELLDEAFKISQIDKSGQVWSQKNYLGGYTSYGSMSQLHRFSSTFGELESLINQHVAKFIKHSEMDIRPKELRMRTCWLNIMPQGVLHSMHLHPLSVLSGTYYVKIPKNSSGLKFEDPRMGFFMASPARKTNAKSENQRFVTVTPKVGELILFESWMRHEVPANPAPGERISISFNYDWLP